MKNQTVKKFVYVEPEVHRGVKTLASVRGISVKELADALFQKELAKAVKKNEISLG